MLLDLDRQESGRSELAISGALELGMSDGLPPLVEMAGTLVVQNLDSRVLLSGTLEAAGRVECGRCLEDSLSIGTFPWISWSCGMSTPMKAKE